MQRSPYPTDPAFNTLAGALSRAMFGDPQAREDAFQREAQVEALRAQAERARAAAGYDDARTSGVNYQNESARSLVELLKSGFGQTVSPTDIGSNAPQSGGGLADVISNLMPMADAEGALPTAFDGVQQAANEQALQQIHASQPAAAAQSVPTDYDALMRQHGPAIMAYAAAMQGNKVDPNGVIGGLAALLGSDEMARRGLVAQGRTPGADFALTPGRADDIRGQGFDAAHRKAVDVASINNRDNVQVANIRANATTDSARIRADAAGNVRGRVDYGKANENAAAAAQSLFPQARITQGRRDPNSALGKANPSSYHNHTGGAVDVAPIRGMSFEQYVQRYRDAGYPVLEAINETGSGRSAHATGDHWHVVLGKRAGGKSNTTPAENNKPMSKWAEEQMDTAATQAIEDVYGERYSEASRKKVFLGWRSRLDEYYRRWGSMPRAVQQLRKDMNRAIEITDRRKGGGDDPYSKYGLTR